MSPPKPSVSKKKRTPVGLYKIYERLGKRNKENFYYASNEGKQKILEEYHVSPRNTSSSSYVVSGVEPKLLEYYNMLPDKWKKMVLKQPVDKRTDFIEYIQALEHNAKKKQTPLGLHKIYERLGKRNKEKFKNASPEGKRKILEEYQVNPRNKSSSSYMVSGVEPKLLEYYNMLPDKWKKTVLKQPVDKRTDFIEYIQALEQNAKNKK